MKIVVKIAPAGLGQATKIVKDALSRVLPKADVDAAFMEPVFPEVTTGRRAGMLVLSLGSNAERDVARVLDSLRSAAEVEYAQEPSERTPRT